MAESKQRDDRAKKKKIEIEWKEMIVLVEIAFEAATPFGVRSGDGESREEFGERTRRR